MTICKERGWGKKGEKLSCKKSGKSYNRTNIVSGYVNKKTETLNQKTKSGIMSKGFNF